MKWILAIKEGSNYRIVRDEFGNAKLFDSRLEMLQSQYPMGIAIPLEDLLYSDQDMIDIALKANAVGATSGTITLKDSEQECLRWADNYMRRIRQERKQAYHIRF